ncbi:hypothetical protein KFU94_17805 [Chloroflexi bacterium TSY]|nr:hypothetical protein [Chloroflexi bacterium TSY]
MNGGNNNVITIRPSSNRTILHGSFLFELPDGFKDGTVTLTGHLNPKGTVAEKNLGNNKATVTVSFEPVPTMDLVLYRIGYTLNDQTWYPSELHLSMLERWLRRAYPISQLRVMRRTYHYGSGLPTCEEVNHILNSQRAVDMSSATNIPVETRYYGMVDDGGAFMRGCGWGPISSGPTGSNTFDWDFDGSYGDWYGGHLLGHSFSQNYAPFCDAPGTALYPHSEGRISPSLMGEDAIYGFNIESHEIYGPHWTDVMSYCERKWISDYTYEGLMDFFQNLAVNPASKNQPRLHNQTERLLILGSIAPSTNQALLKPIYVLPSTEAVLERIPGDYAIVLKDVQQQELARYPFTPQPYYYGPLEPTFDSQAANATKRNVAGEAERELLGIHQLVPHVAGTTTIEILGPDDMVIGRVHARLGKPVVNIVSSRVSTTATNQSIKVIWTAADPDDEELFFSVQYSADGGHTWEIAAHDITEQSITMERPSLHGGRALRIRIWATDGIHTGYDEITSDLEHFLPLIKR